MNQDLVAALGVTISSAEYIAASLRSGVPIHNEYVSVARLRAALEKLPVVEGKISFFGSPDSPYTHTQFEIVDKPNCTHKARLFAIEEIKKEPVKLEFETHITRQGVHYYDTSKFEGKIGRKVKVTVEEIDGNGDPL